jgi:hypothetical protein
MKKIILLIPLLGIMIKPVVALKPVEVRSTNAQVRIASREAVITDKAERKTERQITTVVLRKENAKKEIERRLASLNNLLIKIGNMTKLTAEQKTTLTQQVQEQITNLTALKTKIEAETDPTKLVEERKSIIDNYRIFALFMPKINILAQADKILNLVELMMNKTTNTVVLALINETKITTQNVINKVIILTPQGYPANKTVLQDARKSLASSITKLKEARKLLQ